MKHLFTLNRYFVKYKWYLILGILFVTGSNYFAILIPQKIRDALNLVQDKILSLKAVSGSEQSLLYSELSSVLLKFALIVVLFAILKGVMMFFMRQTIIVMSRLIEYDMRKEIFSHIEKLDQTFLRANQTGDIMARISEDVSKVRSYLGPALLYGINLVTLFVMTIYAMLQVDVKLTFYALLPLPVLSVSIYYVSRVINRKSLAIKKQLSDLNSTAQETYSGIHVVKSYVKEQPFIEHFTVQSEDFKTKSLSLARTEAYFHPLMALLISVSTLLVVFVGGIQYSNGTLTAGNIAEFILYVNMLTWPVTSIGWIASMVQEADSSQRRINHLLQQEPIIVNNNPQQHPISGTIEFKNVTFIYPNTGIKALDNVSFKINRGDRIAIMGKTASGKSTIAELITRMFDINEGQILIDGMDIKDINLEVLRDKIGYVPQDVFLFSDTIAANIAFGTGEENLETIKQYAEYASIRKEIEHLPKQFDTLTGERGVTLSGGQKQRISIARALIKEPEIAILDDSLSAVDTTTEQKILQYLDENLKGKTSIIITHRANNLLNYDNIIVLENGRIVQSGTHDKLVNQKGFYAHIYHQQSLHQAV